jgi:hypothetical protein
MRGGEQATCQMETLWLDRQTDNLFRAFGADIQYTGQTQCSVGEIDFQLEQVGWL